MNLTTFSPEFEAVADSLRQFEREKLVFIPNHGNAGDSFITHSAFQFLGRLGLDFEVGSSAGNYPGRVIVYSGGGNLVPLYESTAKFIARNQKQWRAFILLPHTILGHEALLASLDSSCTLVCRDRMSFDFVTQHAAGARVLLSHDMALQADLDQTRAAGGNISVVDLYRHGVLKRQLRQQALALRHRWRAKPPDLVAIRIDAERTEIAAPAENCDVSELFRQRDFTAFACLLATWNMIRFLDRFDHITTNRLHVCILSAKLGKEVTFHANSYGKNQAIYEHSLKERFPNVLWQRGQEK